MSPEPGDLYVFRAVRLKDFPRLAQWLAEPHVMRWWDAAEVELAAIAQAMKTGETQPMIVEWEGRPIAYLQTYDPHREADHPYRDQPVGTLGLDMVIGLPDDIGRGHGGKIAASLADRLFATGTKRIVIDPHPENSRAIRAYEKAGFRFIDQRHSLYGPAHLMALDAQIEETDTP
ncbi:aminoglycoside 6'-N-acetyltransferase [Rhizobium sp. PP-F2F-G20b]|nr:aminoglycoside 6'-N-acetyltransferase [Rhizobium sp. PP-F2F-G20b]